MLNVLLHERSSAVSFVASVYFSVKRQLSFRRYGAVHMKEFIARLVQCVLPAFALLGACSSQSAIFRYSDDETLPAVISHLCKCHNCTVRSSSTGPLFHYVCHLDWLRNNVNFFLASKLNLRSYSIIQDRFVIRSSTTSSRRAFQL